MPSSNPVFLHSNWCGVVGMSWIGALLISSCITVTFIKGGMLLHTKIIAKCISEIYLLITMIYKLSAYHFRSCIAAREQCHLSIVLKSCLVPVLAKKIEPAF